jgi:hypothetical protein
MSLVVSNSLPLWLILNGYAPPYPGGFNNASLTLYPSFAVPDNLVPPYAVVHIEPGSTESLQYIPRLTSNLSHYQLVKDRVIITFYGVRNDAACDFLDCVIQYTIDTDNFGIMYVSPIRDEKRTQPEFGVLAMKKTIEFDISYYQSRANNVARQLILSCIPTYIFGDGT